MLKFVLGLLHIDVPNIKKNMTKYQNVNLIYIFRNYFNCKINLNGTYLGLGPTHVASVITYF
jgi:hypothetical protein